MQEQLLVSFQILQLAVSCLFVTIHSYSIYS